MGLPLSRLHGRAPDHTQINGGLSASFGNGLYSLALAELPPAPVLQAVISAHVGDDPARG